MGCIVRADSSAWNRSYQRHFHGQSWSQVVKCHPKISSVLAPGALHTDANLVGARLRTSRSSELDSGIFSRHGHAGPHQRQPYLDASRMAILALPVAARHRPCSELHLGHVDVSASFPLASWLSALPPEWQPVARCPVSAFSQRVRTAPTEGRTAGARLAHLVARLADRRVLLPRKLGGCRRVYIGSRAVPWWWWW